MMTCAVWKRHNGGHGASLKNVTMFWDGQSFRLNWDVGYNEAGYDNESDWILVRGRPCQLRSLGIDASIVNGTVGQL
jgi:hypothetical protein